MISVCVASIRKVNEAAITMSCLDFIYTNRRPKTMLNGKVIIGHKFDNEIEAAALFWPLPPLEPEDPEPLEPLVND